MLEHAATVPAAVLRRGLQALTNLYRPALRHVCQQQRGDSLPEAVTAMWTDVCALHRRAADLFAAAGSSEAVRLQAVKHIEVVVLTHSVRTSDSESRRADEAAADAGTGVGAGVGVGTGASAGAGTTATADPTVAAPDSMSLDLVPTPHPVLNVEEVRRRPPSLSAHLLAPPARACVCAWAHPRRPHA